jgi:hypothetical protein
MATSASKSENVLDGEFIDLAGESNANNGNHHEKVEQQRKDLEQDIEKKVLAKKIVSNSPIVELNVGGEKMTTCRATLICVKATELDTIFSNQCDPRLITDTDGCYRYFLDYDPVVSIFTTEWYYYLTTVKTTVIIFLNKIVFLHSDLMNDCTCSYSSTCSINCVYGRSPLSNGFLTFHWVPKKPLSNSFVN